MKRYESVLNEDYSVTFFDDEGKQLSSIEKISSNTLKGLFSILNASKPWDKNARTFSVFKLGTDSSKSNIEVYSSSIDELLTEDSTVTSYKDTTVIEPTQGSQHLDNDLNKHRERRDAKKFSDMLDKELAKNKERTMERYNSVFSEELTSGQFSTVTPTPAGKSAEHENPVSTAQTGESGYEEIRKKDKKLKDTVDKLEGDDPSKPEDIKVVRI